MPAKPIDSDPQPQPPAPPVEGECCGRGCEFCVWVYYDQALRRHEAVLAQWRERQARGGNEESG